MVDADGLAMSALRLSPSRLDLEIFRGDDLSLAVNFTDDAGAPVNVSANSYTTIIADITTGATVATASAAVDVSTVTISVGHVVLASLPERSAWRLVEDAAGSVTTVLAGTLAIADEVQ